MRNGRVQPTPEIVPSKRITVSQLGSHPASINKRQK